MRGWGKDDVREYLLDRWHRLLIPLALLPGLALYEMARGRSPASCR